jgi:hypothetical protein
LISLISLHTVSEEKYPVLCLYVTGLLLAIGLAFSWCISPGLVIWFVAILNPIRVAGFSGCSARKLVVSISERFRTNGLLWVVTILFSLALMSDVQYWHWLPTNITHVASTNKAPRFVFVMMLLIFLITLHCVRKENYPMVSMFAAGFITGLWLSFVWGIWSL